MLTKQKCVFDDKKEAVKWIEVPVEKQDIINCLEERVALIESTFRFHSHTQFLDTIEYLNYQVVIFNELEVLTVDEIRKYFRKYYEFVDRYKELKNQLRSKKNEK